MTSPSPAVSGLTPEERCERVRMALAEAGYRDAWVRWAHGTIEITGVLPPDEVIWRAYAVGDPGPDLPCWPCWSSGDLGDDVEEDPRWGWIECTHDWRSQPWPPLPSRPTIAGPTEDEDRG